MVACGIGAALRWVHFSVRAASLIQVLDDDNLNRTINEMTAAANFSDLAIWFTLGPPLPVIGTVPL